MAKQDSNPGLRPVGITPAEGDMADSGTGPSSPEGEGTKLQLRPQADSGQCKPLWCWGGGP